MQGYGLSVKAINSVTKMEMEKEGKHIWKHVESHTAVLLISPEMLATPGFQQLLQTNISHTCMISKEVVTCRWAEIQQGRREREEVCMWRTRKFYGADHTCRYLFKNFSTNSRCKWLIILRSRVVASGELFLHYFASLVVEMKLSLLVTR